MFMNSGGHLVNELFSLHEVVLCGTRCLKVQTNMFTEIFVVSVLIFTNF